MSGKGDQTEPGFDRELAGLPPEVRWQTFMRRIEAVLFASATPVPREDLARVVGDVSLDLLIGDLAADLAGRSFEVTAVGAGWMLRTRPAYAAAVRVAADVADQALALSGEDMAVLVAVALHQPVTRDGLRDIFGRDISRTLTTRLQAQRLIATGPRSPQRGAPHTFVTTEQFLTVFGLQSLRDLPDAAGLAEAGLTTERRGQP